MARRTEVPPYVVFHDRTLAEIAHRRPSSAASLAAIPGVGPAKLDRYGESVLAVLRDGGAGSLGAGEHPQRIAFFTSAVIFASSVAVNLVSAY